MKILPSIKTKIQNYPLKLLSGLGNNEDSLTAMIAKDWIGDAATVFTYAKEGGKDDKNEKFIEEFGTGAIWLFGIPSIKAIFDKTIYPLFKLDANFDPRLLKDKAKFDEIAKAVQNNTNEALKSQKQVFSTMFDKNPVFKWCTNDKMYKGMAITKFAVATSLAAFGLSALIKYKQKKTTERIEKDVAKQKNIAANLVMKSVKQNEAYNVFTKPEYKTNQPAFTGGLAEFMYNPIKNTQILDAVITGTRLKESRKGERTEVLFKEACQLFFIYKFPRLFDALTNKVANSMKCPIQLDAKVIFEKGLKDKIAASKGAMDQISKSTNVFKTISEMDIKNPLINLLDKNGTISTIKDKAGQIKAIDFMKPIDDKAIKDAVADIGKLGDNIKNIKGAKGLKIVATLTNIALGVLIMGILQPKINILIRKLKNNGDNRNPAIIAQEKAAFEKANV